MHSAREIRIRRYRGPRPVDVAFSASGNTLYIADIALKPACSSDTRCAEIVQRFAGQVSCASMQGRRSHCLRSRLHMFVLALIALGLALQPVLAAAGEMHELAHDPSGQHAGIGDERVAERSTASSGEDAGVLHVLLQCAHCCGSAAAMVPLLKPVPGHMGKGAVITTSSQILPAARLPAPFKPPIFG